MILKVAIHYYGRLAAKQGWRFDSTYDHKDGNGEPMPFVFVLGSGKVSSQISFSWYLTASLSKVVAKDWKKGALRLCFMAVQTAREFLSRILL